MKSLTCLAVMASIMALSGCGSSKVLSGQLDDDNGVAYLHGENKPFTGTVHFDAMPDVADRVSTLLHDPAPLYDNLNMAPTDHCDVEFKSGVMEGHTDCFQRNGDKTLSFDIHQGRIDGESIRYNIDGNKAIDFNWNDGSLEGEQKVYSHDGKYVVHAWTVKDGHKRGKEVRRYSDGSDLAEGYWNEDGTFSGTMFVLDKPSIYTLKDGVKDGAFKQFDNSDPAMKTVAIEGSYDHGNQSGEWIYHGFIAVGSVAHGVTTLDSLIRLGQGGSAKISWKDGQISGPIEIDDKDKNVLLSFNVDDGKIVAPVMRFDPGSGKKWVFTDDATMSALNDNAMDASSNPDLAREAAGMSQRNPLYQQVHQALDTQRQLQAANRARIEYVLDPVHNPDPATAPAATQPTTPGPSSSAAIVPAATHAPVVPATQAQAQVETTTPTSVPTKAGLPAPTQVAGKDVHPIPLDPNQGAMDFASGPFPISNVERNADNLPIYRIECNDGNCVGPTGKAEGTEKAVAS